MNFSWHKIRCGLSKALAALLCLSLVTPTFAAESKPAPAETITALIIHNQIPSRIEQIRKIVRMKEGDALSMAKVENAINDLRKWGVFKSVEVILKRQGKKVEVYFELEDAYQIRDVEIHGNYPLLETRVRRAIFFSTGDIYEKEKLKEQVERLIEFYEKEGYRNTTVLIQESIDETDRMVTLKVSIHHGKSYRIHQVNIVGNTIFMNSRIENKINRFFDYNPSRVKRDLEKIKKLYSDHNFPRARVKLSNVEFNDQKKTVNLSIDIREGKEVVIHFEGNEHQFSSRLRKIIDLSKNGDYDDFELEHSKNQLLQHYRNLGYENVEVSFKKVDYSLAQKRKIETFSESATSMPATETKPFPESAPEESKRNEVLVTFYIKEGPRRVVKKIEFEGNEDVQPNKIKEVMQTKEQSLGDRGVFLPEVFKQDLEKIDNFFAENGYLSAKVKEWKRYLIPTGDKYIVQIDMDAGKKTQVESLKFVGLSAFDDSKLRKQLKMKEGGIYSVNELEGEVRTLLGFFANNGHPYAEIKTDMIEKSANKVDIVFNITEGPEVKIGEILLVGNIKTKPKTILNSLRFKSGSAFSAQKILESQTALRKLNIFDALTLETLGLQGKENTVHIVVRVEEKKDNVVDFAISYDTDLKLQGKLTYSKLNLGGYGKELDVKATGGFRVNRGEIAYIDPRFYSSDWQMTSNVFAQYDFDPFFEDLQIGGGIGFLRQLTKRLSLFTKYEIIRTDFFEQSTNFQELRPGTRDNTTGKLQFSVTYDRRDNFGDPRRGYYAYGRTDFGQEVYSGSLFYKIQTRFGYWYSPFERLTISNAIRGLFDIPLNNKQIPTQELYFLGGDDTIRGFKYQDLNPAGGKVGLIDNFEIELRLFKGFQLVGFFDTASLTNNLSEISSASFRHSAGPGIRYATPVGPLRLEYGFILDRQPGENVGRLHFTFGYFF